MPEHTAADAKDAPVELPAILDMPDRAADFLRLPDISAEPDADGRAALAAGPTVRRGQGYILRVSTTPAVHRGLLVRCQSLDGANAVPAQRKARREYENRVAALPVAGA
ncbi:MULTISPECIES: hypothetical protein [Streptomyces]|uniref:Resolvase n=1 Tax=Streptomyces cacaoi TaxID=1898 RepID=A0A4Y3QTI9_STRCI|nr:MULTISPECIES: hypothetical protein [Streptomyces]NNG89587.1 resolvase [Streptomyces cacaoi]QHF95112.1 resolvase [Streptomyces sp. NHF165]GEB48541.1 hypothetical protein SCA03_10920 [Streptomyces cacaoi]